MLAWPLYIFILLETGVILALFADPVIIGLGYLSLSDQMALNFGFTVFVVNWLLLMPITLLMHIYLS